jgi:hypothetical protein
VDYFRVTRPPPPKSECGKWMKSNSPKGEIPCEKSLCATVTLGEVLPRASGSDVAIGLPVELVPKIAQMKPVEGGGGESCHGKLICG